MRRLPLAVGSLFFVGACAGPIRSVRAPVPQQLVFPTEGFRATQPQAAPQRPFTPPTMESFSLPQGIEVHLIERHLLPTVLMEWVWVGGKVNDPAGKEGTARLCMDLVTEGTEALDKIAFGEAQADLGSTIYSYAHDDQMGVAMRTLTRHLDATLELWMAAVRTPGLRQQQFERLKKRAKADLEQVRASPRGVARRLVANVVYGPSHPLAGLQTQASLGALTVDDCRAFVSAQMRPQGAELYVLGDVTRQQVEAKLGPYLKGWEGRPEPLPAIGAAAPRTGRIFFADVPGAKQSIIRLLQVGPSRNSPDYLPTMIATGILGGDFSSRLNMNLREQHGFAYGAHANFRYQRKGSILVANADVRNDATKEAIIQIFREITKMRSGETTDEELAREKQGAILSLPGQFASGAAILHTYRMLAYYGLPLDYYETFVPRVQAVGREQVAKAAQTHLKPSKVAALVVGDGATVLPELERLIADRALGSGELVLLDADGGVQKPVGR